MEGNFGFTDTLLSTLKKHNNKAPIMITSSVQATLAGRFGNSEYGRSKLAGEELMFKYSEETGAPVYVYRFENMAGKWGRPNYNSAIITFCYNKARDLPITVNDPTTELELVFADDICGEIYDAMEGHPHRCHFEGVEAVADDNGRYCHCPVKHRATLGYIVECLDKFKEQTSTLVVPDILPGTFEYKLYSMFISYLPPEKAIFDLKMNVDERGSFTEMIKTSNHGQVSVNLTKPGVTKGLHWHQHRLEQFIVVAGHGLIRERNLATNEVIEFEVSGDKIQSCFMLPGWSHSISNIGETDLVTVMWAESIFDPEHPDTYREEV
jgi:UDP-2-acetamido-2,6-beta-L-arabino-hexul-4-ose reductase